MHLLHLDSSILGANSVSRQLSAAAVDSVKRADPSLAVTYRDLAAQSLPHLSPAHLAAAQGAVPEVASVQADMVASAAVLDEFLAADIVVIGAPMYNFTVPSQLKAWVDRILVAGKTFRYGPTGPEGLAGGKQVILTLSRGGLYGPGAPAASAEHLESYLRTVFGFIGIPSPEVIVAEGIALGAEARAKAVEAALQAIASLHPSTAPQAA